MHVRDVMSKDPLTLKPTATLREAAIALAYRGVGGCPVVDEENRVVGMLSEIDILEGLKTQHKELRMLMPPEISFGISFVEVIKEREAAAAFQDAEAKLVRDLMTPGVQAVAPGDDVERAIGLMVKHRIHHIPVLEKGRLVGIITRGDILRGFLRQVGRSTSPGAL